LELANLSVLSCRTIRKLGKLTKGVLFRGKERQGYKDSPKVHIRKGKFIAKDFCVGVLFLHPSLDKPVRHPFVFPPI